MKTALRTGTFETNSSSVHSMVMCDDSEYIDLVNNEAFLYGDEIISVKNYEIDMDNVDWDEVKNFYGNRNYRDWDWLKTSEKELWAKITAYCEREYWDGWMANSFDSYLEQFGDSFDRSYTAVGGIKVHAFGCYGYDG